MVTLFLGGGSFLYLIPVVMKLAVHYNYTCSLIGSKTLK